MRDISWLSLPIKKVADGDKGCRAGGVAGLDFNQLLINVMREFLFLFGTRVAAIRHQEGTNNSRMNEIYAACSTSCADSIFAWLRNMNAMSSRITKAPAAEHSQNDFQSRTAASPEPVVKKSSAA